MPRQHWYQRRYYYKSFKRDLDRYYSVSSAIALILGIVAGLLYASIWTAVLVTFGTIIYHAVFLTNIEPYLASFWGEQGQGCMTLLLLQILRWSVFLFLVYLLLAPVLKTE